MRSERLVKDPCSILVINTLVMSSKPHPIPSNKHTPTLVWGQNQIVVSNNCIQTNLSTSRGEQDKSKRGRGFTLRSEAKQGSLKAQEHFSCTIPD